MSGRADILAAHRAIDARLVLLEREIRCDAGDGDRLAHLRRIAALERKVAALRTAREVLACDVPQDGEMLMRIGVALYAHPRTPELERLREAADASRAWSREREAYVAAARATPGCERIA